MRRPCPHCGSTILGIGWATDKIDGKDWCSVICRSCSARGPSCEDESKAWSGWNERITVDEVKLEKHLKLCRRNLKSDRVKCCAECPFEKIIEGADVGLSILFDEKRCKIKSSQ